MLGGGGHGQWLVLLAASRRWRDAPWLPGAAYRAPANGRGRGGLAASQILVIPVNGCGALDAAAAAAAQAPPSYLPGG